MSCAVAPVTWEGSGRERKKKLLRSSADKKISIAMACLQSQNKSKSGTGFVGVQALCGTIIPLSRGFIPCQVVVLVSVGFTRFFFFFCKGEVNTPCLKLAKSKRLRLQSVTQNSKLCNSGFSISHPSV